LEAKNKTLEGKIQALEAKLKDAGLDLEPKKNLVSEHMGIIKPYEHEALRKWAAKNRVEDPESLILRQENGSILFKSTNAAKAYRRIENRYKDSLRFK